MCGYMSAHLSYDFSGPGVPIGDSGVEQGWWLCGSYLHHASCNGPAEVAAAATSAWRCRTFSAKSASDSTRCPSSSNLPCLFRVRVKNVLIQCTQHMIVSTERGRTANFETLCLFLAHPHSVPNRGVEKAAAAKLFSRKSTKQCRVQSAVRVQAASAGRVHVRFGHGLWTAPPGGLVNGACSARNRLWRQLGRCCRVQRARGCSTQRVQRPARETCC